MTQHLLKNSFLRGVLFLLLCAVGLGNAWGEEVTVTFDATKQGYSNQQVINSATITNGITISFTKGTASPAYYTSGTAIRCYAKGGFTITSTIGDITKIVFTYGSSDGSNAITADVGEFDKNTWTGQEGTINFSIGGTSGNRRIKTITVTYKTSTTPDAPTPELESIDFEAADDIEYYVGETVTEKGLTVTANYTNGTNADVTKDVENWTFTPGTINSINDNRISVEFDYAGKTYKTNSFNITVNSIANTAESAYTVAQACAYIDAGKGLSEEVYVKGIVSQVDNFNDEYGSITYWISDDGTTTSQQFLCYGGLDIDGEKFTSIDDLKLGTAVVVKGHLIKNNNTTYELNTNNILISKDYTYTLDLTTKTYYEATTAHVYWNANVAELATYRKNSGTTAANSYLGGDIGGDGSNRTSSRFYKGNTVTLTPKANVTQFVFYTTSDLYAKALLASTYTNASATRETGSNNIVITPTSSGSQISITMAGTCGCTAMKVYYQPTTVEISSAGLATFCLPYNATIPERLTAYTATDSVDTVKLTAIGSGKIAAGEGVVLKGEEGTYTFVAAEGSVNPTAENHMVGVTKDTKLTGKDNAYMLTRKKEDGSIAFRLLKTDYTLGANKAYLQASNTANTRELIPALWDDNATGIDNIAKDEVTATGAIYNLAGQKLTRAQKGINIINGKLVIK